MKSLDVRRNDLIAIKRYNNHKIMNNKMKWAQKEDGLTVTKNETVFWQSETRKETQLPIKYFTRGTKTTKIELMNTANIISFSQSSFAFLLLL